MKARNREPIESHERDRKSPLQNDRGRFTEDRVDVGRSLSADRSEHAQTDEIDDQAAGIDRRTSADDPIWSLMGLVDTGGPGDVARNADLYLADASTAPVDIRSTQ